MVSLSGDGVDASDEAPIRLGAQLRHARKMKKLRLKDVADRSGYSESLISKMENNKSTPSLNTLHRIAKVLGTTVAELMNQGPSYRSDIVMSQQQRPVIAEIALGGVPSDGTIAEVMIPFGASSFLEAFLIRVEPGGSSDGLRHHDGEEVGFVQKGEISLTVADNTYHLKPGDSFFFRSDQPHGFVNTGREPAEIVWVNTPPSL